MMMTSSHSSSAGQKAKLIVEHYEDIKKFAEEEQETA